MFDLDDIGSRLLEVAYLPPYSGCGWVKAGASADEDQTLTNQEPLVSLGGHARDAAEIGRDAPDHWVKMTLLSRQKVASIAVKAMNGQVSHRELLRQ